MNIIDQKHLELINALKDLILEKQEVADGYVFTFLGGDELLGLIFSFIKRKRKDLPDFKFELTIQDFKSNIRLKITGPEGVKDILQREMPF